MSNFNSFCIKHGIEPLVIESNPDSSAVSLRILKLERELDVVNFKEAPIETEKAEIQKADSTVPEKDKEVKEATYG